MYKQEPLTAKIQQWFRDNISLIAIIILSLVYIFFGVIKIEEQDTTIWEIFASCGISFAYGFLIKTLLNNQGLSNGEKNEDFIKTKQFYLSLLDDISDYDHYLERYCDSVNEENIKKAQTSILKSHLLKYEDFINNKINVEKLDKGQKKAYYRARNLNFNVISEAILLSDQELFIEKGEDLTPTRKKYMKTSTKNTLIIMLCTAFLFGYYGIDSNEGFDWIGAIWSLIQVAYYLGFGTVQYFQGYTFMTDTYRNILIRKSNHIEKFKNLYRENPNRFKTKEEIIVEKEKEEIIKIMGVKNEQCS